MKLRFIELNNIGLYKTQRINFPFEESNSVSIIWGNNGAGKTTLINSVKVGLLGYKAFTMEYADYCQLIKDTLISSRCDKSNFNAGITISINLKENHKEEEYTIKREWSGINEEFEEAVSVYKNSTLLDYVEKEAVLNKISELLPVDLLNVIIFDGENAINILNENSMDKLIKSIVYSVFGMNVYAGVLRDLNTYLRNIKTDSNISPDEQLYFINLENEYKTNLSKANRIKTLLETEEKNRQAVSRRMVSLVNKFTEKTGINISDISEINENLNEIEKKKEKMDADIKYVNEEILPLKLLHSRLRTIINTIEEDQPQKVYKNIDFLKQYFSFSSEAIKAIESIELLVPEEKKTIKYDVSDLELEELKRVDSILQNYSKKRLLGNYEDKTSIIDDIKEKLDISGKVAEGETQQMLSDLEQLYDSITGIKEKIINLGDELNTTNQQLIESKKSYDEYKKELTSKKKDSNSYLNAILYRDAVEEFISQTVNNICGELNKNVLNKLKELSFRNNSIKRVEISPRSFDLKLFEVANKQIGLSLFSAGEKQVLLGIVLKEALDLARIDTFFLFDTPVGRLDAGNRRVFTNEVIFKVSEQTIIFATDSDYLVDDYSAIKDHLTSEMVLTRDARDEIIVQKGSIY